MTVGEGVEAVFEQFCEEEEFIRMAFRWTFGTKHPKLHQLVDYFLGPDSKIFQILKDNISIHHTHFSKFIKTFFVQSAYNLSSRKLFDKTCILTQAASAHVKSTKSFGDNLAQHVFQRMNGQAHNVIKCYGESMKTLLLEVMVGAQGGMARQYLSSMSYAMMTGCPGNERTKLGICSLHAMYGKIRMGLSVIMSP